MFKSNYIRVTKLMTLVAVLCIAASSMFAQQYYTITGKPGTNFVLPSYYYGYNEPNIYFNVYSYMWYDYFDVYMEEFLVLAADMKRQGMCAGPISSLSLRFVGTRAWQAGIRMFAKHIAATTYEVPAGNRYTVTTPTATVNMAPSAGSVEVYNNPSWSLAPSAANDSIWVEFEFSSNFVWDGTQNVVFGMCREKKQAGYTYDILGTRHLITEVSASVDHTTTTVVTSQ